jgi:DNA-3-methyladenine glycosylase
MALNDDPFAWLDAPAATVAQRLLGAELLYRGVGGRIVETEAYDPDDPASHAFRGPTVRNRPMFGPIGHSYVYRIYGLHWCFNIVCDRGKPGSAVLIRALEPTAGLEPMRERRSGVDDRQLCSGPGKLCAAMDIGAAANDLPLDQPPFSLTPPATPPPFVQGLRIGITKGVETPWRFCLEGSPHLSRKAG